MDNNTQKNSVNFQSGFTHILVLLILALGLIAGFYLTQHPQILNPKATDSIVRDLSSQLKIARDSGNLSDMVKIAKIREDELKKLAKENPEEFLKVATLYKERRDFPSDLRALIEEEVSIEGSLVVLHFDAVDLKSSKFIYQIKVGDNIYDLNVVKDPPQVLTDSKIKVSGIKIDSELVLASGQTSDSLDVLEESSSNNEGIQRVAVLLANLESDTSTPFTTSFMNDMLFTNTQSLKSYYLENSFNKVNMEGDVFGWYTIPDFGDCNIGRFASQIEQKALSDEVKLTNYDRLVYVFNKSPIGCSGYSGIGFMGGSPSKAWIFYPNDLGNFLHELGHNLGINHASSLECKGKSIDSYANCSVIEYGEASSVMGNYTRLSQFNIPHKVALGWINNLVDVTTDGEYTIGPSEVNANVQGLRINKADTSEKYYISYRQPIGFDSNLPEAITQGANIHIWNGNQYNQTKLIDATPDTTFNSDDAALSDGASFYDSINKIVITQLSHDNNGVKVSVKFNALIPSNKILRRAPQPSASSNFLVR